MVLASALAMASVTPVLATHEPPRLGLTPLGESGSFFDLTLDAGEAADLHVELANFGHAELVARTFSADVYSIINGGFGAALFGEPSSGATRWLEYPAQQIALGPAEGLVIDFSVSVPAGTPPGAYITSLVAENVEPYHAAEGGDVAMEQVNRTAVAIAIDVPGMREPALDIGAVGHKAAAGTSFLSFEVRNRGNVHLKPAGEFALRDAAGRGLAQAPAVMDSVYAGLQTLFEAPLATVLSPGDYCAELSLTDAETGAADAIDCLPFTVGTPAPGIAGSDEHAKPGTAVDVVVGGWVLAVLISGIALIVLILLLLRRRRRDTTQGRLPVAP
jgi:hypothetical protein